MGIMKRMSRGRGKERVREGGSRKEEGREIAKGRPERAAAANAATAAVGCRRVGSRKSG